MYSIFESGLCMPLLHFNYFIIKCELSCGGHVKVKIERFRDSRLEKDTKLTETK